MRKPGLRWQWLRQCHNMYGIGAKSALGIMDPALESGKFS
jgi:hypothetical protein